MRCVLALDQGTTSSRAIVFNHDGEPVAKAQREFRQIFPRPGWVEHDPEEIWSTQLHVARQALERASMKPANVAGIGVTNQRETTVIWDRSTGRPICNAIVWQDRRTAGLCDQLRADGVEDAIRRKTGLVLDAYFAGSKIAWALEQIPGARARAEAGALAFGTIDSWLIYKLTNGALHITDPSNASRTLLYNIHSNDWDDELLRIFRVPRTMMPETRSSAEIYGETNLLGASGRVGAAAAPIPIAAIAGDQMAAMMGQVCAEPGEAKNTYGTGCFLLMNIGAEPRLSSHRLLTTILWRMGEQTSYALEGSVFIGGAIVQWLRDGLGVIKSSREIEALAASVPDSGGVVLVPALAGLGAPHWDQHARGAIFGLTRGATAAHLARAALEGIAFDVADLFTAMESDAGAEIPELRVDGGAAANDLLLQFQADILQRPVIRPKLLETTALGAAYLAGLATGFWKSIDDVRRHWTVDRRFEPLITTSQARDRREYWNEAIMRVKGWERPCSP